MKSRSLGNRTLILAGAFALMAAAIDGKWMAEVEMRNRKGSGKQTITLDLKSSGGALTGNVSAGRRGRSVEIQNGKVEGDKFSFTTVQQGNNGEQKFNWTGDCVRRGAEGGAIARGRTTRLLVHGEKAELRVDPPGIMLHSECILYATNPSPVAIRAARRRSRRQCGR